jgi:hypothetical protein
MKHEFTVEQLNKIHDMINNSKNFDARECFKSHHNLKQKTAVQTDDIEDFMMSFYQQYQSLIAKAS